MWRIRFERLVVVLIVGALFLGVVSAEKTQIPADSLIPHTIKFEPPYYYGDASDKIPEKTGIVPKADSGSWVDKETGAGGGWVIIQVGPGAGRAGGYAIVMIADRWTCERTSDYKFTFNIYTEGSGGVAALPPPGPLGSAGGISSIKIIAQVIDSHGNVIFSGEEELFYEETMFTPGTKDSWNKDISITGSAKLNKGTTYYWRVIANVTVVGAALGVGQGALFGEVYLKVKSVWIEDKNPDITPPSAPSISSPTHPNENIWYANNDPSFTWTTPHDESGIAGYSYVLDQSPSTIPDKTIDTTKNSKSYSNIADGIWYFHIRAKDNAGNWGDVNHYKIKIDTTPPTTSCSLSPAHPDGENGWYVSPVTITLSAEDEKSGIHYIKYTIDKEDGIYYDSQVSIKVSDDGQHTVYYYAVDKAGNVERQKSCSFKIDMTKPSISITSPKNGQVFTTDTITVSGTASDNVGLRKVEVRVGSESWQTASGTNSWSKQVKLAPGSNTIYVRAIDIAGNTKETSVTVIYNRPPSKPSNPSPSDGAKNVPIDIDLSWSCSDPDGDTLRYDIYFGTSNPPPIVKRDHTSTTYDPGILKHSTMYWWKVVVKDEYSKTEGEIWSFTTASAPDTTPPETEIIEGPSGKITYNDVRFVWKGKDDMSSELVYSYKLEGYDSDWSPWTSATSVEYKDLPNSDYTFKVRAKDEAGNIDPTPAERTFTVLVEEWTPYIPSPEQVELESITKNGNTFINVKLIFPNTCFRVSDWGEIERNGNTFSVNTKVEEFTGFCLQTLTTYDHTYDLGNLPDGTYSFIFKCWGEVVKVLTFEVGIQNQSPIANFTYSPLNPVVNQQVTFDASHSYDPDGGEIIEYWWNVSGTVYTVKKFNHTFTTPGLKYIYLEVKDDEGDTSSIVKWINVAPSNIHYLVIDDFESYNTGSFPFSGGWKAYFNALDDPRHNIVTDSTSYSGSKSLQVYGSHSGCWAALVTYDLPKKDVIYIEASMKASGEAGGGCHKNDIEIGLGWEIFSWGWHGKILISFRSDGKIYGIGGPLQDFTPNEWYKIKIKLDLIKGEVTYWINGNKIATRSVDPFDYSFIGIQSGDGKGWIDDIKVYYETPTPTPVPTPIPTPTPVPTPTSQPPIASFIYTPKNPVVNQVITFNASLSYDPDGKIVKYLWDFGDGSKAEGKVITHSYNEPGDYIVTLTVSDSEGAESSASKIVKVLEKYAIVKIDSATALENETIKINITALNVTDLANFDITIEYDPSVVIVTNVENNPVFGESINNLNYASEGWVRIASFNLGKGKSGNVLISTLTLKALGEKGEISHLNLTVHTFVNSAEEDIPVTVQNGTFTIGLSRNGDINGDDKLDLKDAIYLAKHVVGLPGYSKLYADGDINNDGKTDLKDAIYLAKYVIGLPGYEKLYICVR